MPITINGTGTVTGISAGGLPSGTVTSDTLASSAVYLTAPAGAVCFVAQSTAPTGWLKANGAAVSRTTYAALFAALGTTFGVGDGSTTFNLPDLRGEFPRGWDDGRGVDSGRALGAAQSSSRVLQRVGTAQGSYGSGFSGFRYHADSNGLQDPDDTSDTTTDQNTTAPGTGGTTQNTRNFYRAIRPRNIALLAIIKF